MKIESVKLATNVAMLARTRRMGSRATAISAPAIAPSTAKNSGIVGSRRLKIA